MTLYGRYKWIAGRKIRWTRMQFENGSVLLKVDEASWRMGVFIKEVA